MSQQKLEAGKRWTVKMLEEFGQGAGSEWGPAWQEVPKRRGRTKQTPAQLILTIGQRRKVLWIATDDLCAAGVAGPEQDLARAKIRDQVAGALSQLVHRAG